MFSILKSRSISIKNNYQSIQHLFFKRKHEEDVKDVRDILTEKLKDEPTTQQKSATKPAGTLQGGNDREAGAILEQRTSIGPFTEVVKANEKSGRSPQRIENFSARTSNLRVQDGSPKNPARNEHASLDKAEEDSSFGHLDENRNPAYPHPDKYVKTFPVFLIHMKSLLFLTG